MEEELQFAPDLFGMIFALGSFVFVVWIFVCLHKFVKSHMRIADALEKIANK